MNPTVRLREWVDQAVCAQVDGDAFFPGGNVRKALAICAECPVIRECGDWALNHEFHMPGVWGGMTERERRGIRAGRSAA